MYPNFRYLVYHFTGIDLSFLQVVQTFGFFLAIAFLVSGYILMMEMRRKERAGLMVSTKETIITGLPATPRELITYAVLGFLVGWKLVYFMMNRAEVSGNIAHFITSAKGNFLAGILIAAAATGYKYWLKHSQRLPEPKETTVEVHPYQRVGDIVIIAAVSGIFGAKMLFLLEEWSMFVHDPIGSLLSAGGLTFYGGLIAGFVAVWWYIRSKKISVIHMLDAVAPSLILAYGIGRQGCQWAGDGDWGMVAGPKPGFLSWLPNWLWSQNYPNNVGNDGNDLSLNSTILPDCNGYLPILDGKNPADGYCSCLVQGVYPTPLYETVLCLIIFYLLWRLRKKLKTPGMLFAIYLIFNAVERFGIESIRINTRYGVFTQAQWIALALLAIGIGLAVFFKKKNASPFLPPLND